LRVTQFYDGWGDLSPGGNFTASGMVRLFMDNNVPYLCFTDSQNWISVIRYNFDIEDWELVGEPAFAQTSGKLQFFVCGGIPYTAYLGTDNRVHVIKYANPILH
jgi:hypothetical protein